MGGCGPRAGIVLVHDLGETLGGDVPATEQDAVERRDLVTITESLEGPMRERTIALWDEYSQAQTAEARAVKALDKLETLMQHRQGANPPDFDYAFNLHYGKRYSDAIPFLQSVRERIDAQTRQQEVKSGGSRFDVIAFCYTLALVRPVGA